jgi:hypothetical protein
VTAITTPLLVPLLAWWRGTFFDEQIAFPVWCLLLRKGEPLTNNNLFRVRQLSLARKDVVSSDQLLLQSDSFIRSKMPTGRYDATDTGFGESLSLYEIHFFACPHFCTKLHLQ